MYQLKSINLAFPNDWLGEFFLGCPIVLNILSKHKRNLFYIGHPNVVSDVNEEIAFAKRKFSS